MKEVESLSTQFGAVVKESYLCDLMEEMETDDVKVLFNELLNMDQSDWGAGSVPKDLGSQPNMILKGEYLMQVTKVRDITMPKIQSAGDVEEDDGFGATKVNRSGRLLKMQVTDGITSVTVVELSTTPNVRSIPIPGTKVLLSNISVRSGFCVMKSDTFKIIGGRVPHLEQEYQLEGFNRAKKRRHEDGGPPPFVPFGRNAQKPEMPELSAAAAKAQDEEDKPKRVVEIEAADYRRNMGPKQKDASRLQYEDTRDSGKGGGKRAGKGNRVCQEYNLGKCSRRDCKFIHEESTSKRWPGKQAITDKEKETKKEQADEQTKKAISFADEVVVVTQNPDPPPVEKKEERKVESQPKEGLVALNKEEEEFDLFGKVIKKKKPKEPKPVCCYHLCEFCFLINFTTKRQIKTK